MRRSRRTVWPSKVPVLHETPCVLITELVVQMIPVYSVVYVLVSAITKLDSCLGVNPHNRFAETVPAEIENADFSNAHLVGLRIVSILSTRRHSATTSKP